MKSVELDVNRREDWIRQRGQSAFLRVGPFRFAVNTADGISIGFGIRIGGWFLGWGIEPAGEG